MRDHALGKEPWTAACDVTPGWFSARRLYWGIWAFVFLGMAARLIRYLLRFPLWEDEAFLAYNLMNRGHGALLQELDFCQIAPVGYLWLQRTVIVCLGFSELTLRLPALVVGLAGMVLFRRIAQLTLPAFAQLFAVGLFAGSYPLVRYTAEAKQYGFDLFFSLLLTWMVLEWRAKPMRPAWLWALALTAPLAVFMSHSVVFVAGAISLLLARDIWRQQSPRRWLAWALGNALLGAALIGHLVLSRNLVKSSTGAFMHDYWQHAFPPLTQPLELVHWLVRTHAGGKFAFPHGSGAWGSSLTLIGVVLGLLVWRRWRRWDLIALALLPLAGHFLAASLKRYPYGGPVKFSLYWVPLGTLLLGTTLAGCCCWLDRKRRAAPRGSYVVLTMVAILSLGLMIFDFYQPAKSLSDLRGRDFARWFWFDGQHEAVLACLHTDMKKQFTMEPTKQLNWYAAYACNQRIYSARHARGLPPDWKRVSAEQPLVVLEFRVASLAYDETARQKWLDEMGRTYTLVGTDKLPVVRYAKHERNLLRVDHIHVYKFAPTATASASASR